MKNIYIEIIGYVAGFLTSVTFLPQVYHVYKKKSVEDLSFSMIIMNIVQGILWIIYGYYINSLQIIICDVFLTFLTFILFIQKIYYGK